jgi:hypothetical protein
MSHWTNDSNQYPLIALHGPRQCFPLSIKASVVLGHTGHQDIRTYFSGTTVAEPTPTITPATTTAPSTNTALVPCSPTRHSPAHSVCKNQDRRSFHRHSPVLSWAQQRHLPSDHKHPARKNCVSSVHTPQRMVERSVFISLLLLHTHADILSISPALSLLRPTSLLVCLQPKSAFT